MSFSSLSIPAFLPLIPSPAFHLPPHILPHTFYPPSVLAFLSLSPCLAVPCFPLSGLTQMCWVTMRQHHFLCMCESVLVRERERDSDKERWRTCFCTLHLSPVATHHHQQPPSLWSLSASVPLSVHGGLGMDGWSRERGRQNEQTEREREEGEMKAYKTKFRQTHSQNTHTYTEQGEGRRSGED